MYLELQDTYRATELQVNVPTDFWRHIPSSDNLADCASRGLFPHPQLLTPYSGKSLIGSQLLKNINLNIKPSAVSFSVYLSELPKRSTTNTLRFKFSTVKLCIPHGPNLCYRIPSEHHT